MGKSNAVEQGFVFISGVTASGGGAVTFPASGGAPVKGYYNFSLWGSFTGSATLQKSFDGGTTWLNVGIDAVGDPATYTTQITVAGFECENGVLYQINITANSAGVMNCRLSGPNYASNLGVQSAIGG